MLIKDLNGLHTLCQPNRVIIGSKFKNKYCYSNNSETGEYFESMIPGYLMSACAKRLQQGLLKEASKERNKTKQIVKQIDEKGWTTYTEVFKLTVL